MKSAILVCAVGVAACGVFFAMRAEKQAAVEQAESAARLKAYDARRAPRMAAAAAAEEKADRERHDREITEHKFWVGMSADDLFRSLGKPITVETFADATGKTDDWHYSGATIRVVKGEVVSYQLRR